MNKACLQCGNPCKSSKRTFCSQKCRGVHRSENTVKRVRYCESGCGTPCKTMYRRFCSNKCRRDSPEYKEMVRATHLGRKQTQERIDNRVRRTDQKAKELKRKATMLARYGVDNYGSTEAHKEYMSILHTGSVIPRTHEHQTKIIEAKRRNGTLAHSAATKRKIAVGVSRTFDDPNFDRSVFVSQVFNSSTGYYKGLYYRSSYEFMFLRFCSRYCIEVLPASTSHFSVPYVTSTGKRRVYYPDFYLPEFNLVIEIKPFSMLEHCENPNKFAAAVKKFPHFRVMTELSGYTVKELWSDLYYGQIMEEWCYEYICH